MELRPLWELVDRLNRMRNWWNQMNCRLRPGRDATAAESRSAVTKIKKARSDSYDWWDYSASPNSEHWYWWNWNSFSSEIARLSLLNWVDPNYRSRWTKLVTDWIQVAGKTWVVDRIQISSQIRVSSRLSRMTTHWPNCGKFVRKLHGAGHPKLRSSQNFSHGTRWWRLASVLWRRRGEGVQSHSATNVQKMFSQSSGRNGLLFCSAETSYARKKYHRSIGPSYNFWLGYWRLRCILHTEECTVNQQSEQLCTVSHLLHKNEEFIYYNRLIDWSLTALSAQ